MALLIDRREKPGKRDKQDLRDCLKRLAGHTVPVETAELPFGDIAFEGRGPDGSLSIGIERKRLHDLNACIEDARLAGHQLIGLKQCYQERWLLVEGMWRPHDPNGWLMESRDGHSWFKFAPAGRPVMYAKLRRYLFTVQRAGVNILYTRDLTQTAFDILELYHYYQKREHTSLLEKQKLNVPSLLSKPPLVQRWAAELDGVGVKKAELAARLFKTPIALADSAELQWVTIPGIGMPSAKKIVAEIQGRK